MKLLGSPIGPDDEADFYEILDASDVDRSRFENHWPYIIQATRKSGFVYKMGQSRIYSYFRDDELVVVNCFGSDCAQVLKNYAHLNLIPVCIKNVSLTDLTFWESHGFKEKVSSWSNYSLRDDNSYPECIYDLRTLAQAHIPVKVGETRTCRASHANRLRKFIRDRAIIIQDYQPSIHCDAVVQLLNSNAEFLESKGMESMQNVIDAHQFVFDDDLQHKRRLVHIENNVVIGFNYLTVIQNVIFGNAIIHQNETDLMRYLVWQGFNHLYQSLDRTVDYFVTMQGCEHEGQYHWKQGFSPVREVTKTHVVCLPFQRLAKPLRDAPWEEKYLSFL